MTSPNNYRPLPGVTRVPFASIPVGNGGNDPWWCWVLYPVLAVICFPILVLLFGWRR